MNVFWREQLAI